MKKPTSDYDALNHLMKLNKNENNLPLSFFEESAFLPEPDQSESLRSALERTGSSKLLWIGRFDWIIIKIAGLLRGSNSAANSPKKSKGSSPAKSQGSSKNLKKASPFSKATAAAAEKTGGFSLYSSVIFSTEDMKCEFK